MRSEGYPTLRQLYPLLTPYRTSLLRVGDGHQIYVEECGNPQGLPIVFVHGGPGGGISPLQRRFFDPNRYRIILFDQRGCGRSLPHANLKANTTRHLIEDMERIRESFDVDKWVLFGGSWGSTLSLLYAQAYPERTLGLILRGIFLGTSKEIDWFYRHGTNVIFPDKWDDFIAPIPESERDDLVAAYYKRLNTSDFRDDRLTLARAWSLWEGSTVTLVPDEAENRHSIDPRFALAFARIEAHYFYHGCFLDSDDQIIENAGKLAEIPTSIIQGRYDAICPPRSAWRLKQAMPHADLKMVPVAGHSAFEEGIRHALLCATDGMADHLISGR